MNWLTATVFPLSEDIISLFLCQVKKKGYKTPLFWGPQHAHNCTLCCKPLCSFTHHQRYTLKYFTSVSLTQAPFSWWGNLSPISTPLRAALSYFITLQGVCTVYVNIFQNREHQYCGYASAPPPGVYCIVYRLTHTHTKSLLQSFQYI